MKLISTFVLLFLVATVSAYNSCLSTCNSTLSACLWNPTVDLAICHLGIESCTLKCFSKLYPSPLRTSPTTCTDLMPSCPYLNANTCQLVLNDCLSRAFQPQPSSNLSCTDHCNNASTLCSYT